MQKFVQLLLLCLPLVIASCATPVSHTPDLAASVPTSSRLELANLGDTILVDRSELGVDKVIVHSSYLAASGRVCRRLATLQGELLTQRRCQRKNGDWYLSRRLSAAKPFIADIASLSNQSSANSRSDEKKLSPQLEIGLHSDESELSDLVSNMVAFPLTPGETLWSFAARVTGNPMNWQKIAAENHIADARLLTPQQMLNVPATLVKAGQ